MRRFAFALALLILLSSSPTFSQDRGLALIAGEASGQADFDIGRQVAVIIGIDRYKEWTSLRSAVSEANKVKDVLATRYYIDEFVELYDETASAENIRKLFIDSLPAKLGIRDSLLIFSRATAIWTRPRRASGSPATGRRTSTTSAAGSRISSCGT